jgi:hypothetical protein
LIANFALQISNSLRPNWQYQIRGPTRRIQGKVIFGKESIDAKMESILVAAVLSVCAITLVNWKSNSL